MPSNESYPQHVITAVIVAHDGAPWLPQVADAVLGQSRPVQRVVAVDTGSRDRSGAVLASKFGQQAVFGMDRSTGYGAAIARALKHRAANTPAPGPGGGSLGRDRVEWLWLLHDDCEPAPDALEQLLRGVAETSGAAVLGPKLKDWTNRDIILEAGITLDTAARRVTGIDSREVDQGQHDGDRDALAVSSAGMLVRRDVWEQVGGFDVGMGLFMEDVDFCWRVHSAGYRVRVITDAVAYHAQAATKRKRQVSVGRRNRMLDRRNGLLTLLGNLPFRQLLPSVIGNLTVSALRIAFFLLAKRLAAAVDEAGALAAVLGHPIRLISMRRRRARGRRSAYARVRSDLPPGHSVRRLVEFAANTFATSGYDASGSHHASVDPTEDDSLLEDNGLARRLLTSPALITFVALVAVALTAGRSLLGAGPLGGGSLVPAWGGASDLWRTYVQAFHPTGIGSTASAPPWLAVIAALSTLLGGKPWLAIDVTLIGCVPLAGMTAMLAVRRVTDSPTVRVWASATYALLPVATGVIASGRFGSAVAFVLLPLIVLHAGRVLTAPRRQAGRSAWAAGLLVAVAAAFVPLVWLMAAPACVLAAIVVRTTRPGVLRNLAVMTFTAPVLLMPWTLTLAAHPADLLLEAGLPQPGTPVTGLPAKALMMLSPGGPGMPPYWVTLGLFVAALAALLARRGRVLITAGWGIALSGILAAIMVSHLTVRPPDGGPVVVWAGLPLAIAAVGLLLAASVGVGGLGSAAARRKSAETAPGGHRLWAAVIVAVACSAPLLEAASWISHGVGGPVHATSSELVPELVAVADGQSRQVRTLVLRESGHTVSYLLLRGPSPGIADAALTPPADAQQALNRVVAELTTPGASQGADVAQQLARFDIGYVLVQAPVNQGLARLLDGLTGLRRYSTTSGFGLWQLSSPPARVSLLESNGTVVPIPSDPVGVSSVRVPNPGGTLMLAEPAGGWSASLNGQPLARVPSPAGSWAQAFRLPSGGGTLSLSHSGFGHDLVLLFELLAFLVVLALALPGIRVAEAAGQRAAAAGDGRQSDASGRRPAGGQRRTRSAAAAPAGTASRSGTGEVGVGAREDHDDAPADADHVPATVAARRTGLAGVAVGPGASRALRGGRGRRGRSGEERPATSDAAGSRMGGHLMKAGERAGRVAADRAAPAREALGRHEYGAGRGEYGADGRGRDGYDADGAGRGMLRRGVAGLGAGRRASGRNQDEPGERDRRLPGAWPYASEQAGRGAERPPDAQPYGSDDDRPSGRRRRPEVNDGRYSTRRDDQSAERGWPDRAEGRQLPYPGPDDERSGASGSHRASGRSPSGAWHHPGADEPGDRGLSGTSRSPSGRSPSGSWPPSEEPASQPGRDYGSGQSRVGSSESWRSAGSSGPWQSVRSGDAGPGRAREPDPDPHDTDAEPRRRGRRATARHGLRGRRPTGRDTGRSARSAPGQGAGQDELDPLPPVDGPRRTQGRGGAWSPVGDDSAYRGQSGERSRMTQRWSAPAPAPEYEPGYGTDDDLRYDRGYEGDGW